MNDAPRVIPELNVTSLDASLEFYTKVLGFDLLYQRAEERFVMLDLDGARLMLEEAAGPGRRFVVGPLERPFGRGMNLQIQVPDAALLYARVVAAPRSVLIPLEQRWYRVDLRERGNEQFVVADPDGYLLRFFTDLGLRDFTSASCGP
jgi:catechol 2,3-dioxygenase-like lactoylglutathione lyase family enzyme